jgi:hypothetical protein
MLKRYGDKALEESAARADELPLARVKRGESAPKRDPTSDRPQLIDTTKLILFRAGFRSAPIGTPHPGVSPVISVTRCGFDRSRASVLIHIVPAIDRDSTGD